ncbi:MAG: 2-C-methyl-D-erythritol 4-phosphate cytidylyltransferase [Gemmatimonadales bacterium]|jgi:2-C-methyl-D-erythritol 4-phosphate cytidylyltransferase
MSPTSPADSPRDVGVLIAAGGRGVRAGPGEPKQFRPVSGVPLLLRAIRPFASHRRVGSIVVALPQPHAGHPPAWLDEVAGERLRVVPGGETRAASVRAAFRALPPDAGVVLVHDAARPFVSPETIDAVMTGALGGTSVVPGVAVSDTLKRVDATTAHVIETVDRTGLWRAQTPQAFPRQVLERAYEASGDDGWRDMTDEAQLVEAAGFPVEVIPDLPTNIKVTTPEDFAVAEAMLDR